MFVWLHKFTLFYLRGCVFLCRINLKDKKILFWSSNLHGVFVGCVISSLLMFYFQSRFQLSPANYLSSRPPFSYSISHVFLPSDVFFISCFNCLRFRLKIWCCDPKGELLVAFTVNLSAGSFNHTSSFLWWEVRIRERENFWRWESVVDIFPLRNCHHIWF